MRTHHDSLETVLSQTDTAVVVEIQSVGRPEKEGFHLALEITATPLKLLFGRVEGGVLACTYFEGLPHLRGHTKISPRVTGSGLESQIKAGDRVIFLLSSDGTLLRAEALENMARVVRPGPQPDAFSGGPEMP